jgi:hypothetical protein
MVNIRIVETLKHIAAELLKFVHGEIKGLHQLVKLYLVDVFADHRMVAGITYDIYTAKVSDR